MDEPVKQTAKQRRRAAAQRRRTHNVLLAFAFLGFLLICFVINLCVRDKEFSDTENRSLAQKPSLTWETVADGSYFSGLTTYFSDQFFARDGWISIKLWEDSLLGRKEAGGVYLGKNDYLIGQPNEADPEASENLVSAINQFAQRYPNASMQVMAVPMAASVLSDYLPNHAPVPDQLQALQELQGKFSSSIVQLDAVTPLMSHVEEEIYYKTDHHWTSLGAYYGYAALMEAMGLEPVALESLTPTTVTENFNGTIFSSSGVRWVEPDSIEIYIPEEGVNVTSNFSGKPQPGELYVEEFLDKKDKYSYFLGGVQPLCVIETQQTDAPKLLVIRDSYSDSLAPFLAQNFSEIHLWDLRYNKSSLNEYIQANDIDNVVVLYSMSNFVADQNLFLLGR